MSNIQKTISIQTLIDLENEILKYPQVDLPLTHEFVDGVYARSMFIPAGTVLTGAVHSRDCFTVVRYGDLVIYTDDGVKQVKAGDLIPSKAGIKRAGYAITDTLVTGFMANPSNETDLEKLWAFYTAPNDVLLGVDTANALEEK